VSAKKQIDKMETVYIFKGVAYLNYDLAILNGAKKEDLQEVLLNESESFDINVSLDEVTIEDEHENQIFLKTNRDVEFLDTEEDFSELSKTAKNELKNAFVVFSDEFDPSDYYNNDDV